MHVVVVVFAFLWLRSCGEKNNLQASIKSNLLALNDTIELYKNKEGKNAATRLALQGEKNTLELFLASSRDSTEQMEQQMKYFRNVAAAVKTTTKTEISGIEIPFEVPNSLFDIPFRKEDPFYVVSGRSTNSGITLNIEDIPNTASIIIGDRKETFWKSTFSIDVVNSNPYITTTSVDSYVHSATKKRFGVCVFAGYGVSAYGLSPQIGVGVSYNLFQF